MLIFYQVTGTGEYEVGRSKVTFAAFQGLSGLARALRVLRRKAEGKCVGRRKLHKAQGVTGKTVSFQGYQGRLHESEVWTGWGRMGSMSAGKRRGRGHSSRKEEGGGGRDVAPSWLHGTCMLWIRTST